MRIKNTAFVFLLFLSSTLFISAQSSLWVSNPEIWWDESGTLEEAQFSITPRGIYAEVGMYLTFSARATEQASKNRDLEVRFKFTLPEGAQVIDSWLWIGDEIVQAAIEERWSATQTYEDIVGFRRDPSLLTKHNNDGPGKYGLRIYPLQSDSTRRVKITYLVPGEWGQDQMSVPLPIDFIHSSLNPLDTISMHCFLDWPYSIPRLNQLPNQEFLKGTHVTFGDVLVTNIPVKKIESELDVTFDVPTKDGVFLSSYHDGEKEYYGLTVFPESLFESENLPEKNILVLIDYNEGDSYVEYDDFLNELEFSLLHNLNPNDNFNLFFGNAESSFSGSWISGNASSVMNTFNILRESSTSIGPGSFEKLFLTGVEHFNTMSTSGQVLIISSDPGFYNPIKDEGLLSDLNNTPHQNLTFHFAHMGGYEEYCDWYKIDNDWDEYCDGEYLSYHLSKYSIGSLNILNENNNVSELLEETLAGVSNIQVTPSVKLSKNGSACFNKFILPNTLSSKNYTSHMEVGKCADNLPATVEIETMIDGNIYTKTITIDPGQIHQGSEFTKTAYFGNYIQDLEKHRAFYSLTQNIVEEIIAKSIEYRILSLYTAFLALEVSEGGVVCTDCVDETDYGVFGSGSASTTSNPSENDIDLPGISFDSENRDGFTYTLPEGEPITTSTIDIALDTLIQLVATPNPFVSEVEINIELADALSPDKLSCKIYDLNGRLVKNINLQNRFADHNFVVNWDGLDGSGASTVGGVYIFNVQTAETSKSLKLVKLR